MNEYTISAVVGAVLVIAGYVVKKTKTKKDDKIFGIIKNFLGKK